MLPPLPANSLIYCDPPYKGTTRYATGSFDHDKFWQWCRDMSDSGHIVFVSEYNAPDDFKCIWSMEGIVSDLTVNGPQKRSVEKLFVYSQAVQGQ